MKFCFMVSPKVIPTFETGDILNEIPSSVLTEKIAAIMCVYMSRVFQFITAVRTTMRACSLQEPATQTLPLALTTRHVSEEQIAPSICFLKFKIITNFPVC